MSKDMMIHGVSPLAISQIHGYRAKRYGRHGLYNRLVMRKYPFWSRVPIVREYLLDRGDLFFYGWHGAYMTIYGQDDSVLARVEFKNNAQMQDAVNTAKKQLNQFLAGLTQELQ